MKKLKYILLIMLCVACRKPYNPPAIASTAQYLVVEGLVNTGADSTIITLSRTVPLSSTQGFKAEDGAKVYVEGNPASSYQLNQIGPGKYAAAPLGLNNTALYRLRIITADNKTYTSNWVTPVVSPPIDSIDYKVLADGVQINANTHDPKNSTHYYMYSYSETWTIYAAYNSREMVASLGSFRYIAPRQPPQIYQCWQTKQSNIIVLGSTIKLKSDVLSELPVTFIEAGAEKIINEYSIEVLQSALSSDAYNYWQLLKKNTEQLGSIFDAQPTELQGNIKCESNPKETVVGFISAGTVNKKRIFIAGGDLPNWHAIDPNPGCRLDTFWYTNPKTKQNDVNTYLLSGLYVPVTSFGIPTILGHLGSSQPCIDCTLRGSNVRPAFWP